MGTLHYDDIESLHELGEYVSAQRASEMLQVTPGTIRTLVQRQHLAARRWSGHALMIVRSSIEAYQQSRIDFGKLRPSLPLAQADAHGPTDSDPSR